VRQVSKFETLLSFNPALQQAAPAQASPNQLQVTSRLTHNLSKWPLSQEYTFPFDRNWWQFFNGKINVRTLFLVTSIVAHLVLQR
jgi:hypothetical protein